MVEELIRVGNYSLNIYRGPKKKAEVANCPKQNEVNV
jgi:hypothetical protein